MNAFELSGLVAARICHDLVNPVGAIGNGLDLARELEGQDTSSELAMIAQSTARAEAILRLQRLAFGRAPGRDETVAQDQFRDIVAAVLSSPRVSIEWATKADEPVAAPLARLIALAGLCARATLGMAGKLHFDLTERPYTGFTVTATGDHADLTDQFKGWMTGRFEWSDLPEPRQVEFVLLAGACADAGMTLEASSSQGVVTLAFTAT